MAIIEGNYIKFLEHADNILFHLHYFYTSNMFLDTSIICYGSEIYAHKAILAAASPLLRDRLHEFSNCHATLELEAEVQSFNATVEDVRLLIEFIYKGHVCVPQQRLSLFLELGNHFQILGLYKQESNNPISFLSQPMINQAQPFSLSNQDTINYEELSSLHVNSDCPTVSSLLSNENFYQEKLSDSSIKQDIAFSITNPMLSNIVDDNMTMEFSSFQMISENPKLGGNFSNITNENEVFSTNQPCTIDMMNHSNEPFQSDHSKDIFEDHSSDSLPGTSDSDMYFSNISTQPNSYFTSDELDPSVISTDPCLIDLTFQTCKLAVFPIRQQVRLKVKDSIGGVSLQDTSLGERSSKKRIADPIITDSTLKIANVSCQILQSNVSTLVLPSAKPESTEEMPESTEEMPESTEEIPKCTKCSEQFSSMDLAKSHMWEDHSIGIEHKCTLCCFKTPIENKLVEHGKDHLNSPDRQCCICNKKFKTRFTLKNHLACHSSDKWFKCSECDSHYSQKINLMKHMASEHRLNLEGCPLNELSCTDCTFKTFVHHNLSSHKIRCHTLDKAYKCTECNYSAMDKTTFDKHARVHSKEKPHNCNAANCTLSFSTLSSLKRHSRSHTKEKPHTCDECGKQYADGKRLRDHYLKHKSLKPFQCNFCRYSCRRKDNLMSHIKRTHPQEYKRENG